RKDKLKELFSYHYGKPFIEKEILYYNFIERDVHAINGRKELKDEKGQLISPRPKQKFGTDKILAKIDEFRSYALTKSPKCALLKERRNSRPKQKPCVSVQNPQQPSVISAYTPCF
ncbi:MAG: hypothetical protein ACKO2V_15800, partial [Snowella sp.]